jgi:hypothetical protein
MRCDGPDPNDTDLHPEPEAPPPAPLDAAESAWDPWLRALYLRELASEQRPPLH